MARLKNPIGDPCYYVSDWILSQSFVCYVEEYFGNSNYVNVCTVIILAIDL